MDSGVPTLLAGIVAQYYGILRWMCEIFCSLCYVGEQFSQSLPFLIDFYFVHLQVLVQAQNTNGKSPGEHRKRITYKANDVVHGNTKTINILRHRSMKMTRSQQKHPIFLG